MPRLPPKHNPKKGPQSPNPPPPYLQTHPHVAKAEAYVDDVLSGRVIACKWVKLACERHRRDMAKIPSADWPYTFNPDKAEKAANFIELMPHTKGEWAKLKQKLIIEPWQCFIISSAFGWVRKFDGFRRFTEVFILVPRKNGKSALSSAVGLYMLCADDEYGAEIYSGATSEKQALEVFTPAKLMANNAPGLKAHYGVVVNVSNINIISKASKFEPVIGKPGDGASPSCAIVDEYHEHQTSDLYDTMITGMGARQQPLMWVITTAGDNIAGPCYDKQLTLQGILSQTYDDEEKFGMIYTVDEKTDWTSLDALRMANPNFDVSVRKEFLQSRQQEAIRNTAEQGRFKTKHLNMWVNAKSAYFNMQAWAEAPRALSLEELRGADCYLALDLASKTDIAGLELLFPQPDGHYHRHGLSYLPEATVQDPKNNHYKAWELNGKIKVTEGEMIDFALIKEDILQFARDFNLLDIAYDQYQATFLITQLMDEGLPVTEYRMSVLTMSDPMKMLDALLKAGKYHHDCDASHPMTWQMSNVVARRDSKDNVYPNKQREEAKIDNPVAAIMALGRALALGGDGESAYETRGILLL